LTTAINNTSSLGAVKFSTHIILATKEIILSLQLNNCDTVYANTARNSLCDPRPNSLRTLRRF
jgi:hypothetical protein